MKYEGGLTNPGLEGMISSFEIRLTEFGASRNRNGLHRTPFTSGGFKQMTGRPQSILQALGIGVNPLC